MCSIWTNYTGCKWKWWCNWRLISGSSWSTVGVDSISSPFLRNFWVTYHHIFATDAPTTHFNHLTEINVSTVFPDLSLHLSRPPRRNGQALDPSESCSLGRRSKLLVARFSAFIESVWKLTTVDQPKKIHQRVMRANFPTEKSTLQVLRSRCGSRSTRVPWWMMMRSRRMMWNDGW